MKNSESQKFEESWRSAFSDAEANPPDSVWTNIDLKLSRAESGEMKRRVVFYQRLAAASVVFAIALGGLGIWYSTTSKSELIADSILEEKAVGPESRSKVETIEKNSEVNKSAPLSGVKDNEKTQNDIGKRNQQVVLVKDRKRQNADQKATLSSIASDQRQQDIGAVVHDSIPLENRLAENGVDESLKKNNEVALNNSAPAAPKEKVESLNANEILPILPSIEPLIARAESKKKTNSDEDWWASLGGAAGSYNPNAGTSNAAPVFASSGGSFSSAQQSSPSKVGTSYSFGMNFGKKIAPRVMLMSGFNYLTQSNEYNSNVARLSSSNSTAFAADALSQSATAPTTPYTISSVNEFVSIPFQAGYLFIDRKLGLQLNTGIATDFFVKNTLSDQSGKLLRSTQGAGDNSSYRTVNLTGLLGTELSYKVAKHYRVSLVPGLRYSLNSVLKSTTGSSINPIVWDVGFRFRYMF